MTEELFLKDSYTKEFEARVVKLEGREVILDRTAFYPGGGRPAAGQGVPRHRPYQCNGRGREARGVERSSTSWTDPSLIPCGI